MEKESLLLTRDKYNVLLSESLETSMETIVDPFLKEYEKPFILLANDGNPISGTVYRLPSSKGTIMISHGFTESQKKYREMIYYFLKEGYNVCVHDHRNHGHSRTSLDKATHIENFQEYVDDFYAVVRNELNTLPKPYYVFAHSMGGLIASTFIEQYPNVFEKAILSSPLFEVNRGGAPYGVVKNIARGLCLAGKGKDLLPGQGVFNENENFEGSASTCYQRYLTYFKCQLDDPYLQSGGSTSRWVYEIFKACESIKKKCSSIQIPVLLFQADQDDFVFPEGQDTFISTIQNGHLIFVPGSKHEIYLSDDATMRSYVYKIFEFLKEKTV